MKNEDVNWKKYDLEEPTERWMEAWRQAPLLQKCDHMSQVDQICLLLFMLQEYRKLASVAYEIKSSGYSRLT